ncbi:E3 SUMO-protein ligase ZBED1-like isoform X1 [Megalobrama amblycephala]|uniref:E3 SUMO-protein ligase ZBED1-like isoform X1 n=1 Tax=Megalobrama amblycephala TaxID=75352 RepID=UPI00201406E6|nr:E3 SUMO-protein ligase ZBED1-like isoform X1 [Megalobrama amblycephala]
MLLSLVVHTYSLRYWLPAAVMLGTAPAYLLSWSVWRLLSTVLPTRLYHTVDDRVYSLYQSMVLFFFENYTGVEVIIYGDIPKKENVVYLSNHQSTADWIIADMLAIRQNALGHVRYVLKDGLKWLPLYGWYFSQHGGVYVKRSANFDEKAMKKKLSSQTKLGTPMYLVIFPEGTRYNPELKKVIDDSQAFAAKEGLTVLKHILTPRMKASHVAIETMKEHLDAVYDITVAYEGTLTADGQRHPAPTMPENAVKDDSRISRASGLCKKLVGHFSHSWKKKVALTEAQEELQLPKHALITECPTRWGSRQRMIERVLEQQKALSHILLADRKTRHLVPQWQDTDVLESVSKALRPLQEFTDALSGEDYVSVSYLKPVLHLFSTKILAVNDEDSDLTNTIKSKIVEYLNKNYDDEDTQELLDMASFLDPRFKTNYIAVDKLPNIRAKVMSDMKEVSQKDAVNSETTTGRENVDTDLPSSAKKTKKSLGSFFKTVSAMPASLQLEEAIASEMNSYLLTPSIDSAEDPLQWWKLHQINFPRLSKLAQKYLCIPATSSPSERVFSTGGNVVTCQRSCLKPEMVDMLACFLSRKPLNI